MLWLSEIMLQNQLESFEDLLEIVAQKARDGDLFFRMDIRPPYPDTPVNWEDRLEATFTSVQNQR